MSVGGQIVIQRFDSGRLFIDRSDGVTLERVVQRILISNVGSPGMPATANLTQAQIDDIANLIPLPDPPIDLSLLFIAANT